MSAIRFYFFNNESQWRDEKNFEINFAYDLNTKTEKYFSNPNFLEFVNREFDSAASDASTEELAEFAFGGVEEAILKFSGMIFMF
ncbi:MAG: hypothetical protein V2A63_01850 [Patescibacteria group bacterium]